MKNSGAGSWKLGLDRSLNRANDTRTFGIRSGTRRPAVFNAVAATSFLLPAVLLLSMVCPAGSVETQHAQNSVPHIFMVQMRLMLFLALAPFLYYSVFMLPLGFLLGAWVSLWRALRKAPELREFFEAGKSWEQLRRSLASWFLGSVCLSISALIMYTRKPDEEALWIWLAVASAAFAGAWILSLRYIFQLYVYLKSPQALQAFDLLAKPSWQARWPKLNQHSLVAWRGLLIFLWIFGQVKLIIVGIFIVP